jgi:hypothetical protein
MKADWVVMIRKTGNPDFFRINLKGKDHFIFNKGLYAIDNNTTKFTSNGKKVVMKSEGNFMKDLVIDHNLDTWIDSQTAMKILNDKHIQEIVSPDDSSKELLMMIGAVCSIVGSLLTAFILLILLGIIKVGILYKQSGGQ